MRGFDTDVSSNMRFKINSRVKYNIQYIANILQDEGKVIIGPGELFCRMVVDTDDGELCEHKCKLSNALGMH